MDIEIEIEMKLLAYFLPTYLLTELDIVVPRSSLHLICEEGRYLKDLRHLDQSIFG